ncbi:FUSC family protein [Novosphingobium sp. 1949]|uniref:FUSC family protein n=1 Tax=Novosphingobium organovorum TaxID=2930092 RepID=A0ABT0BD31_9SPHN|nr:FUSC family protein [Novosphingobium organovorum]MCJ2182966.1 FUSC family protein [Novosphingobium organovorum]
MARWGINAALFSLKCYAGAMLALYIAFSIGLERPYWAFLTAYIVSGPLAGAVVSKALFRLIGTFVGAVAAVALVPPLVHSPPLLVLAMATWLGLCVFVSLLDRTPRAYMFVLAGYTAGLIVWPTVDAPTHIFLIASLRAQEIAIGILCSALVHAVVLPNSLSAFLLARADAIVHDAEAWSRDTLDVEPCHEVEIERRRLAQDITELHQLSVHLPFETSRPAPRVRVVRALQDNLSELLPLGAAIADRIAALRAQGSLADEDAALLADMRGWMERLATASLEEAGASGAALQARCAGLEPEVGPHSDWLTLLRMSLLARLAQAVDAHINARVLVRQLGTLDRRPVSPRVPALLEGDGERPLHRDYAGALRGAAGAFITIVLGSVVWIETGWSDGGTFLMLAGVFLSLFSAMDNSLPPVLGFFKGTFIAAVAGALYGFAILPMMSGFPELAISLAPCLLLLGAMLAVPRFSGFAMPAMLGLGSPFIVSESFGADLAPGVPASFAGFVNGQVAQLAAVLFSMVLVRLFQTAGIEHAIRRTLRAGWLDIAERANRMSAPDVRGWIARMLDRLALLTPRLMATGKAPGEPLYDLLTDLRTGVAIGELRQLRLDTAAELHPPVTEVLSAVGAYYRRLEPDARSPADPELLARIDAALQRFCGVAQQALRRRAVLPLITLRRNLFPDAAPFAAASALVPPAPGPSLSGGQP